MISLGVFAFVGLRIGVIKAILLLVALMAVIATAGPAYAYVSQWLTKHVASPGLSNVLAVVLIVLATLFIVTVAAAILRRVLSMVMLGWVDRAGGAAVGLAAGGVLAGILLAMALKFPLFDVSATTANSTVATIILERFPVVLRFLSEQVNSLCSFLR